MLTKILKQTNKRGSNNKHLSLQVILYQKTNASIHFLITALPSHIDEGDGREGLFHNQLQCCAFYQMQINEKDVVICNKIL